MPKGRTIRRQTGTDGRTSAFGRALAERQPDPGRRRWLFVPHDQLSSRLGPLAREAPEDLGIVLVESTAAARRRPYHRQKLALVLANLRHFALEQAERGVAVRHVVTEESYASALKPVVQELGPLRLMEPAERELRVDVAALVRSGEIEVVPHEGWLTRSGDFETACGEPPWRMDAFYRHVRRQTGLLMVNGKPAGGRWSFDTENRCRWRGRPRAPEPPTFEPDSVTREVGALVEERHYDHPGRLDLTALPATAADAERLWRWALTECLPHFGPYEDAMSTRSRGLFHTRISALLNLHRLIPARVVGDVAALDLPIASQEGFVRQVIGWREFMHHVHTATDGFRELPHGKRPPAHGGGAAPSFLGAVHPLPPAWWGTPSGLACLDRVVADVWDEGWSSHITRLMVLANLATLLDVSPRELTDWFWVAYTDAYDWVVEPNVLGMGTFAVGDLFTTKPYVSGAAYIDRMSDHCAGCAFDPVENCPITRLYWAFLGRHRTRLSDNPRLRLPLASLRKRATGQRREDVRTFERVRAALAAGERLEPAASRPTVPLEPTPPRGSVTVP